MVDLTPFKAGLTAAWNNTYTGPSTDPRSDFQKELSAAGFELPKTIELGRIRRISDPHDKGLKKSGWYLYNEFSDSDGSVLGVGVYGSWRGEPDRVVWTSKKANSMSIKERADYAAAMDAAKVQRDNEQKIIHEEAAARAFDIWNAASQDCAGHEYLTRKGVRSHGLRVSNGNLVMPIICDDAITSLQFITADGTKKLLTGGRKKGCYYKIKGDDAVVYIAEGYATGASIHEATGHSVYVAIDAGNLYEVAAHIKDRYKVLIVAGDDDRFTDNNPGKTKAMQAAQALGIEAVFPSGWPTNSKGVDFNDLASEIGLQATAAILLPKKQELYCSTRKEKNADYTQPTGFLSEVVAYYNATSGNAQPLFAIQTALALAGVICARHYRTNIMNATSLYMINIGKSGTGKEHARNVIEKILEACNHGKLVSGDGYTSGSAVFSALQSRPRHITFIDEFAKYLQSAKNKYSSGHLADANNQLMQVYSRNFGTFRPKTYSAIGVKDDQRKKFSDMKVLYPNITLLAMTTPDDMFSTISVDSIKDGFINRFLICISEAERTIRQHKEPIDVPQSIIDWVDAIIHRVDGAVDDSEVEPTQEVLSLSVDANEMQIEFQRFLIDKANSLEKYGMGEITARSNEIALRIALIHALSRDVNATIINTDDMKFAIDWVKFNLLRLIENLKMSIAASDFEGYKKETLKAIRQAGEAGITWATMQKTAPMSKYRTKDLKEILDALEDANLVQKELYSEGRGRPTNLYKALA